LGDARAGENRGHRSRQEKVFHRHRILLVAPWEDDGAKTKKAAQTLRE
jgi:hypothetical protein